MIIRIFFSCIFLLFILNSHAQKLKKPVKDKKTGAVTISSEIDLLTNLKVNKTHDLRFGVYLVDTGSFFITFIGAIGPNVFEVHKGDSAKIKFAGGGTVGIAALKDGGHNRARDPFGNLISYWGASYDVDSVARKKLSENEVESIHFSGTMGGSRMGVIFEIFKKKKDAIQKAIALFKLDD